MGMWEAQDLNGADKVTLMSAADRIQMTGFTSNASPRTIQRYIFTSMHQSLAGM